MLKIGEFSRLSQVTVKTLHHYDELGLIKPVHIDPLTNYRFYEVEQLPRIHRIMALKEMGLSLEQIGLMLEKELSTEEMRGMLRLKQAEIQQEIREEQRQLSMVEFRLRMIEAEVNFPDLDVVMKKLEPMRVLSFFVETVKNKEDGPHSMENVVSVIKQAIADGRIQHTGIAIDVFHGETILPFEAPELGDDQHEILLGVTRSQESVELEGIGSLKVREEAGIETAATLMLSGKGGGRIQAVEQVTLLRRWAIAHGYTPSDFVRYFHHRGPLQTLNREEFIIEAQLPVDTGEQDQ
ncbi:MAG TPA: helix-turn-helix domain-containing protein [Anaerolineales bacterium]|nr:helix-turn-helix domain-containing protein [Anaerolineales bacterium]